MEKRHIGFELTVHDGPAELPEADRELLGEARSASGGAYAPYSGFRVGAAIRMGSGEIVIGNNQENASYPSGLCAERVAVFQAGARFPDMPIDAIAIYARSPEDRLQVPAAPCGNCRQSILEYEHRQKSPIRIYMQAGDGVIHQCASISDLLPLGFDPGFLS